MPPFTTALGPYGGVLWSGELQGFILHEMAPTYLHLHPTPHLHSLAGGGGAKGIDQVLFASAIHGIA
jgi:hypothetical protein